MRGRGEPRSTAGCANADAAGRRAVAARWARRVLLKAENLQLTGSFKLRGASNALARLPEEELSAGVVAASAGNHAQALAFAARGRGAGAALHAGEAPLAKVAAVRQYGGEVRLVEGVYDDAGAEAAAEFAEREGATLVHAFDNPDVVAGQGTVGLEIARQAPGTCASWSCRSAAAAWRAASRSRLGARRARGGRAGEACAPYVARSRPDARRRAPPTRSATASRSRARAS